MDDDIVTTDAESREYWRHDVTESLAGSCSYSHHAAAWNVQSEHCALLEMDTLWRKLRRIVAEAYALCIHTRSSVSVCICLPTREKKCG